MRDYVYGLRDDRDINADKVIKIQAIADALRPSVHVKKFLYNETCQ